jgi:hypothetical protein
MPISKYELSRIFDELYEEGHRLFMEEFGNPCDIGNEKCTRGSATYCCGGCEYLSEDGCTTKSLGCKLFICDLGVSSPEMRRLAAKLRALWRQATHYHLGGIRVSKEDDINHAYRLLVKEEQDGYSMSGRL